MSLTIKARIDNAPDQIDRIIAYLGQMRRYFLALNDPMTNVGDLDNFLNELDTPQFELDCRALVQLSLAFATHLNMAKMFLNGQELDSLDLLHTTVITDDVSSSSGS